MKKYYRTVEEAKARISALLKEGYLFYDIHESGMYFIRSNEMQAEECWVTLIMPYRKCLTGPGSKLSARFSESKVKLYFSEDRADEERHACKIFENYVFDIFDFHLKYTIKILYAYRTQPNTIRFKLTRSFTHRDINMDDYNVQLSEEMLGEISFARNIIEEYARKGIYDILCEYV